MCAPLKKFGQKIKNFEILFDIIDNHTCVHMHVKKNFEIFHFSADFFSWSPHARLVKKFFFVKKLFFVHILILDVQILSKVVHLNSGSAIFTVVNLASGLKPFAPRGL